ncbi:MAG: type II secretion system F family protein, partial [Sandaracinobacteroides sp.]
PLHFAQEPQLMAAVAVAVSFGTPLAVGALLILLRRRTNLQGMLRARVALVAPAGLPQASGESPLRRLGDWLARTPLVGSVEVDKLRQTLYAAGLTGPGAVDRFIGFKIILAGLLIGLGTLWLQWSPGPQSTLMSATVLLGTAVAGLRGPDFVLGRRAAQRREAIDKGLADALDLLVVCAEAGIGIELGLERVARELREVHPQLAAELAITVSEMRMLSDRLQGLHNMGDRVQLESVRSIASTLSQTLKYGTPLGKALRTLTSDFRLVRQTRMEERAARLPVLITVPMIVFILPATTLVVAGPAFLQLLAALTKI